MPAITYTFAGPPHLPPVAAITGDLVVCELAPLYTSLASAGIPYLYGHVTSRAYTAGKWRYVVEIPAIALVPGAEIDGALLPQLHATTAAERALIATRFAHHWREEAFSPTEAVGNETRWLGNPDIRGTIAAVRFSVATPGDSTAQLLIDGVPAFGVHSLDSQTFRITTARAIQPGQRIDITTSVTPGLSSASLAHGLQIELTIEP